MDYDYKVLTAFSSDAFLTAFDCVFKPTLNKTQDVRVSKFLRHHVSVSFANLRKLWRARLWKLHSLKLQRLETKLRCEYAVNCPPFGVRTDKKACVCFLPCCPFCFGRRTVIGPFFRLLAAVDSKLKPHEKVNSGFAAFRTIHLLGDDPKFMSFARMLIVDARKRELKLLKAKYGFVQHHVQRYAPGMWALYRYGVTIADRTDNEAMLKFNDSLRAEDECRYVTGDLSSKSLRKAFQLAVSFPSWWFTGELKDVKTVIEGLEDSRRFATYGLPPYAKEPDDACESTDELPPANDYI